MNKFAQHFLQGLIIVGSLALNSIGHCATPVYEIVQAEGTFIQVPLQHELFKYTSAASLSDLVVLDAEQHPLPYRLVTLKQGGTTVTRSITNEALAFFPVAVDATPDTMRKLHRVQVNSTGDTTQVLTSDKTLDNTTPEFYLIDLSKIQQNLTAVNLDWSGGSNNQYLEVELEATSDLTHWMPVTKATLVHISENGENLTRNRVALHIANQNVEFLRIKILRGADGLIIDRIVGELSAEQPAQKPEQETWSLKGEPAQNQTTVYLPSSRSKAVPVAAWEFTRTETTPIDNVAIGMDASGYTGSAKIFSRNSAQANWALRYQGIWFNAQIGDKWETSDPVNVGAIRDLFWRIELNAAAKTIPTPNLVLSWQPYQLQFIANNKAPYVIAIDSRATRDYSQDQVFNQMLAAANPQWIRAGLRPLSVSPEAFTSSNKNIDWTRWLFWLTLVFAVGVLMFFSVKLFKQLNSTMKD